MLTLKFFVYTVVIFFFSLFVVKNFNILASTRI